ncbi:DUF4416 family protein [Aminirod propionatiphilus]|uniref:DUF4416 family protein n=1 Tax=Aminirod propionatiphilus TaxID=3415223 RepID=A0ACD1DYX7_9BACT|nr:DUF4416 family protein [Synergistota bacterium]
MTGLVKRVVALLYPDREWLQWVLDQVEPLWGRPERLLEGVLFASTDYYREIAPVLYRGFCSFPSLQSAEGLVLWKKTAIALERRSAVRRRVNIDPGYVDGARLVLASTKDHGHRVYLGGSVFAEVTLLFRKGRWCPLDYTYSDFRSGVYDAFLSDVRRDWCRQVKEVRQ